MDGAWGMERGKGEKLTATSSLLLCPCAPSSLLSASLNSKLLKRAFLIEARFMLLPLS